MRLTPSTFIISDLHFGHKMQKFGVRPDDFEEIIAKKWNETVSKADKVLCLGDLTLTGKDRSIEYFQTLKGKKYLVLGNHDNHSESWYRDCGFEVIEPIYKEFKDKYENRLRIFFTHEPVMPLPSFIKKDGTEYHYFNVHGHLHGNEHRDIPTTDHHMDMSAEVINYTPQPLYKLLDIFKGKMKEGK